MPAKLVAATQPTDPNLNLESFVAYCARVSNPSNQSNTLTAAKLLSYCAAHQHWSVFEMANVVLQVDTTRDIARQLLRHRSFSFQEFSQRYAAVDALGDGAIRECRLQDAKNRQNSLPLDGPSLYLEEEWQKAQSVVWNMAKSVYQSFIERGVAREVARAVLPEGLTPSRLYVNGTLRSWIHYCKLRMGPETQREHRELAADCWREVLRAFPAGNSIIERE